MWLLEKTIDLKEGIIETLKILDGKLRDAGITDKIYHGPLSRRICSMFDAELEGNNFKLSIISTDNTRPSDNSKDIPYDVFNETIFDMYKDLLKPIDSRLSYINTVRFEHSRSTNVFPKDGKLFNARAFSETTGKLAEISYVTLLLEGALRIEIRKNKFVPTTFPYADALEVIYREGHIRPDNVSIFVENDDDDQTLTKVAEVPRIEVMFTNPTYYSRVLNQVLWAPELSELGFMNTSSMSVRKLPAYRNLFGTLVNRISKMEARNLAETTCTYTGVSIVAPIRKEPTVFLTRLLEVYSYDNKIVPQYDENGNLQSAYYEKYKIIQRLSKITKAFKRIKNDKPHIILTSTKETKENFVKLSASQKNAMYNVNSYNYSPSEMVFLGEGAPYLGAEIELGGCSSYRSTVHPSMITSVITKNNPHMYVMHDGSVDYGFEMATVPATLESHMDTKLFDYKNGFKVAKALGFTAGNNDSCGLHVHVSKSYFSNPSIAFLLMNAFLGENWLNVVRFTRRSSERLNRWASPSFTRELMHYITTSDRSATLNTTMYNTLVGAGNSKYVALNYYKPHTMEFRIFRGTLNYRTYMATLQFVHNLSVLTEKFAKSLLVDSIKEVTVAHIKEYLDHEVTFDKVINHGNYVELKSYVDDIATNNSNYKDDFDNYDNEDDVFGIEKDEIDDEYEVSLEPSDIMSLSPNVATDDDEYYDGDDEYSDDNDEY